jgi:hypothetical protein
MKKNYLSLFLITLTLTASALTSCGSSTDDTTAEDIGNKIESSISNAGDTEQQGTLETYDWVELGSLTDVEDLRSEWDSIIGNSGDVGEKTGMLYLNASNEQEENNTLQVVLHNELFTALLSDSEEELGNAASLSYTDIGEEDAHTQVLLGLNGYFNLIQDSEPSYANPNETLTRAQVMSAVMRATTQVGNIEEKEEFTSAVGQSEYNIYAQALDATSYLSTSDGSLNSTTYNGVMTRAEAVYLLVNTFYTEDMEKVEISEDEFSDCSNGGDMGISSDTEQEHSQILKAMLENPDNGVDESIYKALVVAKEQGMIDEESNWDLGITKAEFMDMLVQALENESSMAKFSASPTSRVYEVYNEEDDAYNVIAPEGEELLDGFEVKSTYDGSSGGVMVYKDYDGTDLEKSQDQNYQTEFTRAWTEAIVQETGMGMSAYDEYVKSQGADDTLGGCWLYYHGEGAGSEPSYAVDPVSGERYELGDILPDGSPFLGTMDEQIDAMMAYEQKYLGTSNIHY